LKNSSDKVIAGILNPISAPQFQTRRSTLRTDFQTVEMVKKTENDSNGMKSATSRTHIRCYARWITVRIATASLLHRCHAIIVNRLTETRQQVLAVAASLGAETGGCFQGNGVGEVW